MNKLLPLGLLASLPLSLCVLVALAADVPDRPIGIGADEWIPIAENLGFVVSFEEKNPLIQGQNPNLLLKGIGIPPSATGYFVARTPSGWRRLNVVNQAQLTPLTH